MQTQVELNYVYSNCQNAVFGSLHKVRQERLSRFFFFFYGGGVLGISEQHQIKKALIHLVPCLCMSPLFYLKDDNQVNE